MEAHARSCHNFVTIIWICVHASVHNARMLHACHGFFSLPGNNDNMPLSGIRLCHPSMSTHQTTSLSLAYPPCHATTNRAPASQELVKTIPKKPSRPNTYDYLNVPYYWLFDFIIQRTLVQAAFGLGRFHSSLGVYCFSRVQPFC